MASAMIYKIEAFLHVNDDEEVSDLLDASKQVILDKCSSFLQTIPRGRLYTESGLVRCTTICLSSTLTGLPANPVTLLI